MKKYFKIILILIFISLISCTPPGYYTPKPIEFQGTYFHNPTQLKFPRDIDGFTRKSITSHNKEVSNVSVKYVSNRKFDDTKISIYVYPAGDAVIDRLYNEYLNALAGISISADKDIEAHQRPFNYESNGYKFIGLEALVDDWEYNKKTLLVLFECGEYFLKYRFTFSEYYFDNYRNVLDDLFRQFNPSFIVKSFPLNKSYDIIVSDAAYRDSLTLNCILAGALSYGEWIWNNVDSFRCASGFPGLDIIGHKASFNAMNDKWVKNSEGFKRYPNNYFESINIIINNNYLNEFLMEQYNMLLITPDSISFDFDAYNKWKKENIPNFNLEDDYFLINLTKKET